MTAKPTAAPDWFDKSSDWCNPILVKEVRQALKSRAFVVTFTLLLLGSWGGAAFGLLVYGQQVEYGRAGQMFFAFYLGVLCLAMLVIVPFGAFRSLLNERDENTYELLSITTLSPGQIVRGKWACALVQGGLFYSAIAPFIAFTSLLQGFDFAQAAYLLVVVFYASAAVSITTLMLGTTVKNRVWQGFMSLAVLGLLAFLFMMSLSMIGSIFYASIPFDDSDFWWVMAFVLVMSASYMFLFYQVAASRLTFEAENRSTGIRATAALQFWMLWIAAGLFYYLSPRATFGEDVLLTLIVLSGLHWMACGLSFAAESDDLSRRVARSIPRQRGLRPFLAALMPGGARGLLFVLLHLMALWLLTATISGINASVAGLRVGGWLVGLFNILTFSHAGWANVPIPLVTAVCAYIALYSGLVAFFQRVGHAVSTAFGPAHARTVIVVLVALGIIGPMGIRASSYMRYNEVSVLDTLFPFWLLGEIFDGNHTTLQLSLVVIAACLAVALNIPAMVRGVAEIMAGPPVANRPQRPPTAGQPVLDRQPALDGQPAPVEIAAGTLAQPTGA